MFPSVLGAKMGSMEQSASSKYVIIGAGIHGLSTAYHLALQLKATGKGSGEDILVVDKAAIGGGASGIACGVVRNNYFQLTMRELMAHPWKCGKAIRRLIAIIPSATCRSVPSMHSDAATIYEQQKAIGYESTFIEGTDDCQKYMLGLFDDWQAKWYHVILYEKRGGYANNTAALYGLA